MSKDLYSQTPLDVLVAQLRSCAGYKPQSETQPAAILWTDKECQWQSAMPLIKQHLPELIELGKYDPTARRGPAIWIKCAIARTVGDLPRELTPIIYLPGQARKEMRAIELCPEELKPLAELQYRGVWWATPNNSRDWTVSAFLTNKTVGLELDLAKDEKSQQAMLDVLPYFLQERTETLQGRRLSAKDFHQLVADDPVRDLLLCLNDTTISNAWDETKKSIFKQHVASVFGLQGDLSNQTQALHSLCEAQGAWAEVWERFVQMAHRLPRLVASMKELSPQGLAYDSSHYLSVNLHDEAELAESLLALPNTSEDELRGRLHQLLDKHQARASWLWYELSYSPNLEILQALCEVEQSTRSVLSGPDAVTMAQAYAKQHWQTDAAALAAMAKANDDTQRQMVAAILAVIYTPWLTGVAENFQRLVQEHGYPGRAKNEINQAHSDYELDSQVVFFVDGLRYDVAQKMLAHYAKRKNLAVKLSSNWSALPSLTDTAKAAVTPIFDLLTGSLTADDFKPMQAQTEQSFSGHFLKTLLSERGWQYLDGIETGDPTGKAWVQIGDIDNAGHQEQLRLPNRINSILQEVEARIDSLINAGWRHIRVVTDHGWLWVPDQLPKAELPKDVTTKLSRRCGIIKGNVATSRLSQPWHWNENVRVAMAPGISAFTAGDYYNHGGLSLQECMTPVLNIHVKAQTVVSSED